MLDNYLILPVAPEELDDWDNLSAELWPEQSAEETRRENQQILDSLDQIAFLAKTKERETIGFIELSLRHEYVAGAKTSPVVYMEGIYVKDGHRDRGIGAALIRRAEEWALSKGCNEIASDALLGNDGSINFHKRAGFQEVERTVAFIKTIQH